MDFVLVNPTSKRLSPEGAASSAPVERTPPTHTPTSTAPPGATPDVFRSTPVSKPQGLAGVDRRWSPRTKIEKPGWIAIASRDEPVACTVSNVSKHGAMLELAAGDTLGGPGDRHSATFVLVWLTNRVRSEATCTMRWRNGRLLGINFVGPVRTMVDRR